VKALCDEIPNLKSLFWVFRVALDMRGLIELYYGGIGSYGLFNMIAAALSRGPIKHAPLTAQMLHVLDFYGCDFDMTRRGLAVTAECTPPSRQFFLKHSLPAADLHSYADLARLRNDPIRAGRWQICRKSEFMPYLLCLQDPVDPTNDLGKKSYAIKHIVRSIEGMRNQLYKAMSQREDALRKGEQPMSTPYLKRIVGVCQSVYWKRRKRLEDVGNGVLKGKTLDQIAREKRAAWEKGTFGSATTIHKEADDVDGEARQTGLQENGNEARTEVYEAEGEEMEEVEKIEKIPKPVFEETYGW
jgi:non-canonical poly(A) RNA polymerase PAPD5/7